MSLNDAWTVFPAFRTGSLPILASYKDKAVHVLVSERGIAAFQPCVCKLKKHGSALSSRQRAFCLRLENTYMVCDSTEPVLLVALIHFLHVDTDTDVRVAVQCSV